MKKTFFLQQFAIKLEMEVPSLKNYIRTVTNVYEKELKIEGQNLKIGETSSQLMVIDVEKLEAKKEVEIRAMENFLIHKIDALKLVSQNVHGSYIAFEGVEYKC